MNTEMKRRKSFLHGLGTSTFLTVVLLGNTFAPAVLAQDISEKNQPKSIEMPMDLPALAEIDALDGPDALIRRFFLTSQGMRGQTVPLPETEGWFCTLSQATHVMLDFWPNLNQWAFQVGFSEDAELTAGGLATCHQLSKGDADK